MRLLLEGNLTSVVGFHLKQFKYNFFFYFIYLAYTYRMADVTLASGWITFWQEHK